MISSLLLISFLFSVSVHSFYITNTAVLEQCSTPAMTYLAGFDPTKMFCVNAAWRQTFIFLEYSCIHNTLTRLWTIKTNSGKNFAWPQVISLMTNTEYTRFDKTYLKDDPTIEENSNTFDPNNNQLTTYLWTSLAIGPQCRMKYTILKDICTANKGAMGAKFMDAICYYGKQTFNFQTLDQRQFFDSLVDNNRKSSANIPSTMNNQTNSHTLPNHSPINPNAPAPAALNADKPSFWTKYKRYILIGGGIFLLIIVILIAVVSFSSRSSSKKISGKVSDESTIE